MTKVITFFSQKGGCGKTTLSVIIASYLAYIKNKKILVIDADGQHSFFAMRNSDLLKSNNENFKALMQESGVQKDNIYPVSACTLDESYDVCNNAINSNKYDYIVVDLPGTVGDSNIFKTLLLCDYIIVPCEHSAASLESSLTSAVVVTKKLKNIKGSRIKKVGAVFNKVPYSQLTKLKKYLKPLSQIEFDYIFRNVIGSADTIDKFDKSSTLLPTSETYLRQKGEKLNLGGFLEELESFFE